MNKYLLTAFSVLGIVAILRMSRANKGKNLNSTVNEILNNKFAKSNVEIFNGLHPEVKQAFASFLQDIVSLGYAVVLTSGTRSSAKQAELKKQNPKNATPGFSTHEYGIGLDLNLVKNGKWINKSSSLSEWKKTGIVDIAKRKYKMRWGGDFKGYSDPIHFDFGSIYDINKLYAAAIKKFGSPDKIRGTEMTLAPHKIV